MRSADGYLSLIEAALPEQLASLGEIPEPLHKAMAYSLEAGGKRLRPMLLLASCEMAGGSVEEAMPFACALEMIHTYSLIHDDLPAMDNDDLRRGKPTNHKMFGEAMAILAGDGLLSAAGELMLHAAVGMRDLRGARAAEAILRRAGVTGMVAGQTMDVTGEGGEPTAEKVVYIHLHKTADLITAPVEAGLLLAGASEEQVKAGVAYGQHLGVAFQIVDDVLDVRGDTAVLGKTAGKDAAQGKLTWVAVRGLEGAREDARDQVALAVKALDSMNMDINFLKTLAQSTLNRVQ